MSAQHRVLSAVIAAIGVFAVAGEARASCSDGIQNGTETGVDCGGTCLKCNGATCAANTECVSGSCVGTGTKVCTVLFSIATSQGTTAAQPQVTIAVDPALTIAGDESIAGARVVFASGFVSGQDVLGFTNQGGITGSWSASTGVLTLSGTATAAAYQAALRTVTYTNTSATPNTADRVITFSLGPGGLPLALNGHFYEFIGGYRTWHDARNHAVAQRYFGLQGYLATITTAIENAFVHTKLSGQGWIGASDEAAANVWRWVTGPEGLEASGAGRHFFNQSGGGGSATREKDTLGADKPCTLPSQCDSGVCTSGYCYHYTAWSSGEPNNYGTGEQFAHFYTNGVWNDYYANNTAIQGYVIEYGGLPTDPPVVLLDHKTVRIISVSCSNDLKDGSETDVDCGGSCAACTAGLGCAVAGDCTSFVCFNGLCQNPTCADTVRNGSETDVDCGGACTADCAVGEGCNANSDCESGKCTLSVCQAPTCSDSVRNASETDVDCGGGTCPDCANGNTCTDATDCVSNYCVGNVCLPAGCTDGVKNGSETGVDCGGGLCAACGDGVACNVANDCTSRVCTGNLCRAATCSDAVKNGDETGTDCGGSCTATCGTGGGCLDGSDCTSGVCAGNVCQAPTCFDGLKNGAEIGTDCGGGTCAGCGYLEPCNVNSDCLSAVCTANVCDRPLSCSNGVKDGNETDIDCGGGTCLDCSFGEICALASDCDTAVCTTGHCACPDGEEVSTDGTTCIGVGECDGFMTCAYGATDLVFFGVVADADGDPIGSIRCVQAAATGAVTCDTVPGTTTLAVSPVLWCE